MLLVVAVGRRRQTGKVVSGTEVVRQGVDTTVRGYVRKRWPRGFEYGLKTAGGGRIYLGVKPTWTQAFDRVNERLADLAARKPEAR